MKTKVILSLFIIGLMSSCFIRNSKENNTRAVFDFKAFDTTIAFFGCWLSEDYFNSIKQFKSPHKAQDGSAFIVIPDQTLKPTMMIDNFHEGGPPLTVLKDSSTYQLWSIKDSIISLYIDDIEILSEDKIKIGDRLFVKINPFSSVENLQILEEILFKGQYITSDGKQVEFKNDGKLIGLDNYSYYIPAIDYFDAGMQIDQIELAKSQTNSESYGFKFNNDTLELFKLNCLTFDSSQFRCVEVTYGKLAYKMWRNNKPQ